MAYKMAESMTFTRKTKNVRIVPSNTGPGDKRAVSSADLTAFEAAFFVAHLTNIWETLTYEVVEIKIIMPNEVKAIHIQEGRELLTLLTCHPYASGGKQRLLVICERIYETEE